MGDGVVPTDDKVELSDLGDAERQRLLSSSVGKSVRSAGFDVSATVNCRVDECSQILADASLPRLL